MGIEGFNKILDQGSRKYRTIRSNTAPDDIDSLLIDANGEIYNALAQIRKENEGASALLPAVMGSAIAQKTVENIDKLFKHHKPKRLLAVIIDGTAPDAKVAQQKKRRYMAAYEQDQASTRSNKVVDFDTTVISPGTMFMNTVVAEIKKYLGTLEVVTAVENIIFSTDVAPGEGEHKIMSLFRDGFVRRSGSHVIVGSDNDLIVLASIQTIPNIYIYKSDRDTYIDVNLFKYYIMESMTGSLADIYNGNISIMHDFIVVSAFLGNDFIPTPIACMRGTDPKYYVFDVLLDVYRKATNNSKKRLVDAKGHLIIENVLDFAILLAEREPTMLLEAAGGRKSEIFDKNFQFVSNNYDAQDTLSAQHTQYKTNYETFVDQWRVQEYKVNPDTRGKKATKDEIEFQADDAGLAFMCGISWTLAYYITGKTNYEWIYRFVYAPMLANVDFTPMYEEDRDFVVEQIESARTPNAPLMTIPQVLFNILPSNVGKNVIPDNLRTLVTANAPGYTLTIDHYGLDESSHIFAINLPFVARPSGDVGEKLAVIAKTERYKPKPTLISERNQGNINVAMREKAEEEGRPKSKRTTAAGTPNGGEASPVAESSNPSTPVTSVRRPALKKTTTTTATRPQRSGMIKQ